MAGQVTPAPASAKAPGRSLGTVRQANAGEFNELASCGWNCRPGTSRYPPGPACDALHRSRRCGGLRQSVHPCPYLRGYGPSRCQSCAQGAGQSIQRPRAYLWRPAANWCRPTAAVTTVEAGRGLTRKCGRQAGQGRRSVRARWSSWPNSGNADWCGHQNDRLHLICNAQAARYHPGQRHHMVHLEVRTTSIFTRRGVGLGIYLFAGLVVLLTLLWTVTGDLPVVGFHMHGGWRGARTSLVAAAILAAFAWWLRRPRTPGA